jgi:hypothetical protein
LLGVVAGLIDGALVSVVVGKAIGGLKGKTVAAALRPLFMGVGALMAGAVGGVSGGCLGGLCRAKVEPEPPGGEA